MTEVIAVGAVLVVSLAATFAIVLAVWHLVMMVNAMPKRWLTSALGPLLLAFPGLHSESGNVHRVRFLIYSVAAIGLVSLLIAADWLLRR